MPLQKYQRNNLESATIPAVALATKKGCVIASSQIIGLMLEGSLFGLPPDSKWSMRLVKSILWRPKRVE